MSVRNLIVITSLLPLFAACGHSSSSYSVAHNKSASHPTDCALDEQHYSSVATLSAGEYNVNIERDFQNVVHQDCEGKVTKSGIETVQPPTAVLNFAPIAPVRAGAVRLFNDTACDWSTANLTESLSSFHLTDRARGTTDGKLQLTLDASKGASSFHVKPGKNTIFYTYYSACVPDSERHTAIFAACPATQEISSGSFTVNVNYSEQTLSGDKIERDSCR